MIAALFVEKNGVYAGLPGVDAWDRERDARGYAGPHAVVAHPPCERWGRFFGGNPQTVPRKRMGDDDGCFAAAVAAVRKFGGVLEHPEASHAWAFFGILKPPKRGGWVDARDGHGWTCCVEQGHYGHLARKATWLYYVGPEKPPELKWGPSVGQVRVGGNGYHTAQERAAAKAAGKYRIVEGLGYAQRIATPAPFRELLLNLARNSRREIVTEKISLDIFGDLC